MSGINAPELGLYHNMNRNLVLKFDTGSHAIDAKIMAEALGALNICLSSATSVVKSCKSSRLQVVAISQGSVEVALTLSAEGANENADSTIAIVNAVAESSEIYKFLNGKPIDCVEASMPKSDTFKIKNSDGQERRFSRESYMTFVDSHIPPLGELEDIVSVDLRAVELLDAEHKPILSIESKDFHCMSRSVVRISNEEPYEKIESCLVKALVIPIGKPRNAWSFEKDGESFTASILDEEFIGKIDRNELSFHRGDRFRVNLKTVFSIDSITLQRKAMRRQILSVVEVIGCRTVAQDQLI